MLLAGRAIAASLAVISIAAADVRVDVDATTKVQVNGVTQVRDGLFGLDGAEGGNHEQLEAANMHAATGSSAWIEGVREDPERPGQIDRDKLQEFLDNAKPSKGGYRIDHYIQCLQGGPDWQSGPKERRGYVIPHALDVYAEWAEAVIRHRLKTMPDTEHYFQFFGEISLMGYWNTPAILRDPTREGTNCNGREAARRLVKVVEASAARLEKVGLEARLGTPGLTDSLQWADWRTWRTWWELMIDRLGDKVDFYGVHWYDMTQDNLQIEAGLIQNAQEIRWGNRKPICCQESDMAQGAMDNPQKGTYNAYYLWAMLDMPDKVIVNTNHLRDNGGTFHHNMFRADRRLPKYWAYWIMRDLRGTMLATKVTPAPTTPSIAERQRGGRLWLFPQKRGIKARSAIQDGRLCVLVWNDGQVDEQVRLSIATPSGQTPKGAELSHVFFDTNGPAKHESEHGTASIDHEISGKKLQLSFPARADTIYALAVDFDRPIKQTRTLWAREFFGDQIMFHVPGPSHVKAVSNPAPEAFKRLPSPELRIRAALAGARSARLKVALNKALGDWEDTLISVNGKPYVLPVAQHVNRAALVEIPVSKSDLRRGTVQIEFLPHLSEPYQVLWASLVTSNEKSPARVSPILVRIEDDGPGLRPGEARTLSYTTTNRRRFKSVAVALRWVLPRGWSIDGEQPVNIKLAGGQSTTTQAVLHPAAGEAVAYQQIALIAESDGGRVVARRSYKLNPPVRCRKFAKAPTIDGQLDDWQQHQDAHLKVGERTVQVWTGWDVDNFYVAAFIPETTGQARPVTELRGIAGQDDTNVGASIGGPGRVPRGVHALNMFLDLGNEKGIYNYDANDHHFWLVTPGLVDPKQAEALRLPIAPFPEDEELTDEQKKKFVWHKAYVGQTVWQGPLKRLEIANYPHTRMACLPAQGGYVIEAAIGGAWSWAWNEQAIYGYWPEVGHTIGFDFVCDDHNVDPLTSTAHWGRGYESLHRYYVTSPRELVRGNPAVWGLLRFEE